MKPWYKSRTLIFNVVAIAVAIATLIADPTLAQSQSVVSGALGVVTIGNMVLRLLTDQPIEGTPAARKVAGKESPGV